MPTVLLSNHPGHGRFRGEATGAAALSALIEGLDAHGWLSRCAGIISGYLGAADQARVVAEAVRLVKAQSPRAIYLCDPVFGDDDGAYARPGVAEAMARELVPLADIVAPNRFELASLTSKKVTNASDAVAAARALGKDETVVTSVPFEAERIGTVTVTRQDAWTATAPRIAQVPNGSGDLLAALYFGARLQGRDAAGALAAATSAVDGVLRASAGADELRLVAAQAELCQPSRILTVESVR